MDSDNILEKAVSLLSTLQKHSLDEDELKVLYTALYIAVRVMASDNPVLVEKFLNYLIAFAKEEIDKENITLQ